MWSKSRLIYLMRIRAVSPQRACPSAIVVNLVDIAAACLCMSVLCICMCVMLFHVLCFMFMFV